MESPTRKHRTVFFIVLSVSAIVAFLASIFYPSHHSLRQNLSTIVVWGLVFIVGMRIWTIGFRGLLFNDLMRNIQRLETEDPDLLISKAQHRKRNRTAHDAIFLAVAYNHQGNGAEGQRFATETLELLNKKNVHIRKDKVSRGLTELAQVALYDAHVAQGYFAEAANGLRPHIDAGFVPNILTTAVIWALYLARKYDEARAMFSRFRSTQDTHAPQDPVSLSADKLGLSPKYALIVAYMRHKLLGVVNADELLAYREAFPKWEKELARNAHNPYGARLREIVDEMRPLLAVSNTGGGLG